jgi:DNA-binding MarR family transcriptional regulator
LTNEQPYDNIAAKSSRLIRFLVKTLLLFINKYKVITSKMTTDRQLEILQYLSRHDSLEVGRLSELLRVSPSTVRRDLRVMQKSGLLKRMHGTAQQPTPIHY